MEFNFIYVDVGPGCCQYCLHRSPPVRHASAAGWHIGLQDAIGEWPATSLRRLVAMPFLVLGIVTLAFLLTTRDEGRPADGDRVGPADERSGGRGGGQGALGARSQPAGALRHLCRQSSVSGDHGHVLHHAAARSRRTCSVPAAGDDWSSFFAAMVVGTRRSASRWASWRRISATPVIDHAGAVLRAVRVVHSRCSGWAWRLLYVFSVKWGDPAGPRPAGSAGRPLPADR
jgi:hypothetical protein